MQELAGSVPRTDARYVTTILLEVVCDLYLIELSRHPEIGEEENHETFKYHVTHATVSNHGTELIKKRYVEGTSHQAENLVRKH